MNKTFGFFKDNGGEILNFWDPNINVANVSLINIPNSNVAYGINFEITSDLPAGKNIYYKIDGPNNYEIFDNSLTGNSITNSSGNANINVYIKSSSNVTGNTNCIVSLHAGSIDAETFYTQNAIIEEHTNIIATGGAKTNLSNGDKLHTFLSNSSINFSQGNAHIEYLIIAGGGGGGNHDISVPPWENGRSAGGGGAGGLIAGAQPHIPFSSSVTIGLGGSAPGFGVGSGGPGNNGGNSVVSGLSFTAIGGGGGGAGRNLSQSQAAGRPGGSGGGGGGVYTSGTNGGNPGAGTTGQGNDGGRGYYNPFISPNLYAGAGGGGAGASGADASGNQGGGGGAGYSSSITGTATLYAGGGGGCGGGFYNQASGGSGGGGQGGNNATFYGGGGGAGGDGYNGIVYFRYGPYGKKLILT